MFQKPRSRHEELKERARVLLENARKEQASKQSAMKSPTSPAVPAAATLSPASEVIHHR